MSQRQKEFQSWSVTKQNVPVETVRAVVAFYFDERLKSRASSGGSHNLLLSLSELTHLPDFQWGHLMISTAGGQGVKPRYLRLARTAYLELIAILDIEDGEILPPPLPSDEQEDT